MANFIFPSNIFSSIEYRLLLQRTTYILAYESFMERDEKSNQIAEIGQISQVDG